MVIPTEDNRPDRTLNKPRWLVEAGISASVMSTKGFGKSDRRVPGDSEQARAANRRVEIAIVDAKLVTNDPLAAIRMRTLVLVSGQLRSSRPNEKTLPPISL